jgi:excisionase family DNA binding protein
MAIEAVLEAERMHMQTQNEQRRIVELELQQARYEAGLAERRYAACDPDNRLIAAQLEKSWEGALRRVEACQVRLDAICAPALNSAAAPDFAGLAEDLETAWNAPGVTMRARQQLVRALIADIIADVDEKAREIILTIHWQGGQHSQLRIRKPGSGEHGRRTTEEALAVFRSMSSRWPDQDIAASLNRMGMRTGQGMTWNSSRVSSLRRDHGIYAYRSAEKNAEWLTMCEAAKLLGVTNHVIRRLIKERILHAEQVVPGAPYQIRASDMQSEAVTAAIGRKHRRVRTMSTANSQCLSVLQKEGHNEHPIATGRMEFSARLFDSSSTGYLDPTLGWSHGQHDALADGPIACSQPDAYSKAPKIFSALI